VLLDASLRDKRLPTELTPEATSARPPTLLPEDGKLLAVYADATGANAGSYLRWLDAQGVIGSAPLAVASGAPVRYLAKGARGSDRSFIVAWAEVTEPGGADLFVRAYSPALEPLQGPVRVTDYVRRPSLRRSVRGLDLATGHDRLHLAYAYAQDPVAQIRYQALGAELKAPGLVPSAAGKVAKDRTLGEEIIVSPKASKATDPSVACGRSGCFIAWHALVGQAGLAFLDPASSAIRWQRPLGPRASHPTLGAAPDGEVRMVWTEAGRLNVAKVGPEGIGPASRVARVVGEQPAAAIAAGAEAGEWVLAWLDFESGRPEPYVARLRCR
jgi:eukaryotic-like serine/threonine-protein kinase